MTTITLIIYTQCQSFGSTARKQQQYNYIITVENSLIPHFFFDVIYQWQNVEEYHQLKDKLVKNERN